MDGRLVVAKFVSAQDRKKWKKGFREEIKVLWKDYEVGKKLTEHRLGFDENDITHPEIVEWKPHLALA